MQNFFYYFKKYGKDTVVFLLLIICAGLMVYNTFIKEENQGVIDSEITFTDLSNKKEDMAEQDIVSKLHVDVKGAVKQPGVYEVDKDTIINDVINLAGGFLTTAYKDGINMSKKVIDEMVIYVYTKSEIQKFQESSNSTTLIQTDTCKIPDYNICECVNDKQSVIEIGESDNKNTNSNLDSNEIKIININTASVQELTSLSGVGETKAQAIVKYRDENGKFSKIEDIMNVSGIGEKAFESIKEFITV